MVAGGWLDKFQARHGVIICNSGSLEAEMGENCMYEASLGYKVRSGVKTNQPTTNQPTNHPPLGVKSDEPPQILPRFTAHDPASPTISGTEPGYVT